MRTAAIWRHSSASRKRIGEHRATRLHPNCAVQVHWYYTDQVYGKNCERKLIDNVLV